jgi:hypothetical protein
VSQTAKNAGSSRDKLIDIFNRIERFFHRLEIYTGITPTATMRDIIIEIMVEILTILAIATKEVKRGRLSKSTPHRFTILDSPRLERFLGKLTGNTDIENSLNKLDKLTQEEARMASAELLKATHTVDGKVTGVDDRVKGVDDRVKGVEGKVQDVCDDVQDVGDKVQTVDRRVQDVDDKLDQVNRAFSLQHLLIVPSANTTSQGTSSETVFHDGFRLQIHPPIITTHAKLITTAQLNGFFKELYSINGNPLDPSCGYTENVRYSWPSTSVKS